ncbi:tripartite tricarboxylate transporter substrate binding protein [Achromobacter spanius]|uniref:Bug family tripartite tricarboxylate transporter substrate binding protein n=1 Tax=Achromobacter spanius TaxID=217203 RepID=UPI00320B015A
MRIRNLLLAGLAMLLLGTAQAADPAADFPNRPIRLVISFPAGSGSDIIARYLGKHVSATLGQPIVVEPKVGAQGSVAAREVARAKPDGYTLLLGTNSTHAANFYMMKDIGYDPVKDFSPVTQLTSNPLMLVVRSDLPARDMPEFLQYARARPGQLNYGTGNSGGLAAAQLLKTLTGIQTMGIPYPGTPQAVTDLIGGRLDYMITDVMVTRPYLESGKLRALGVTSRERLPSSPDVAPLAELGVEGYEFASWVGLFAPAGTPPGVVAKINAAFVQALKAPDTRQFFDSMGMLPAPCTPQEFSAYIRAQLDLWGKLTRDAGVSVL